MGLYSKPKEKILSPKNSVWLSKRQEPESDKVFVQGHWKTNYVRGPKFGTRVWIEAHFRAKPVF
jgi:hypothetical protein